MPNLGLEVLLKGKNLARILGGLDAALKISMVFVAINIPLGIILDIPMTWKNPACRVTLRCYLESIRIMPQMVLLFLVYFGITGVFDWDLSGELASATVLTVWETAEMGDLVRGVLISIPIHQYKSAGALGLTRM